MKKSRLIRILAVLVVALFTFTGCSTVDNSSLHDDKSRAETATQAASTQTNQTEASKEVAVGIKKPEIPPEDTSEDIKEPRWKAPEVPGLTRGVNLGNALEAPMEGSWGVVLQEDYFKVIKDAGFNFVRIPIKFSGYASLSSPYTINEDFLKRVDWAADQAISNGLYVILDMHNYEEFMQDPNGQKATFIALWKLIAKRYCNYSDNLYFELLNEPTNTVPGDTWNSILADTIKAIRKTNPKRQIVVGPVSWNSITELQNLKLPEKDRNLIATYHYYNPFEFTHQGAGWVSGSDAWLGTPWAGNSTDKVKVRGDLEAAAEWAVNNNRPLLMGEFGVYSSVIPVYRERWTRFVAREAEKRNIAWSYWEFCSGFGVYNPAAKSYRPELLRALIPDSELVK
jgi:endoglucanase